MLVGLIETEPYAKSSFHVLLWDIQLYIKKKGLVVLTTASGWLPWLRGLHVLFRGISDCVYISEPIMFIKMVFSCSPVRVRVRVRVSPAEPDYDYNPNPIQLILGICMCRVFASHTCPVCSRRGRPIVSWENEMAKRSLVEVYEEVSEVHHH